jgi:hypothetical protein
MRRPLTRPTVAPPWPLFFLFFLFFPRQPSTDRGVKEEKGRRAIDRPLGLRRGRLSRHPAKCTQNKSERSVSAKFCIVRLASAVRKILSRQRAGLLPSCFTIFLQCNGWPIGSASIRAGVSVRADYLNSRAQRAKRFLKKNRPPPSARADALIPFSGPSIGCC